jgi:hypothetical protein
MMNHYTENVKYMKILQQLDRDLGNTGFINSVITECVRFYEDIEFYVNLDNNVNLIGFKNGVYDLIKMQFRNGLKKDNISIQIDYEFSDIKTKNFEYIEKFFEDVMPDEKAAALNIATS